MKKTAGVLSVQNVISWLFALDCFLLCYLLAAIFLKPQEQQSAYVWRGIFLLLPLALSDFAVSRIRNFFFYLVFAAAFCGSFWLVFEDWLTLLLTAFIFVTRATVKIKKAKLRREFLELPQGARAQMQISEEEIPTFLDIPKGTHFLLFAAVYAVLILSQNTGWIPILLGQVCAGVCLYLFYLFFDGMENFIGKMRRRAGFYPSVLRRTAGMVMGLLFAVVLSVFLPVFLVQWDPAEQIRFSQEQREDAGREQENGAVKEETAGQAMEQGMQVLEEGKEPPEILVTLAKITEKLFAAAILIAALFCLFAGIFQILKRASRYYSRAEEDQVMFLERRKENGDWTFGERKEKQEGFFGPRMRIRRKYRRLILSRIKERPAGFETPEELEEKAGVSDWKLHQEYEQARYDI